MNIYIYISLRVLSTCFRRFIRYKPKYAPNVCRLIDEALIGIFLMISSYFKIRIWVKCRVYSTLGPKRIYIYIYIYIYMYIYQLRSLKSSINNTNHNIAHTVFIPLIPTATYNRNYAAIREHSNAHKNSVHLKH